MSLVPAASRFADSAAGGDLSGSYPNPSVAALAITAAKIAAGTITDAQVAAANKDGAAATPSLRTLGTTGAQAAAGNDSRLTDSRTPSGAAGGGLGGTFPNPTIVGKRNPGLIPTGGLFETIPRMHADGNSAALSTQRLTLIAIDLPTGVLITTVSFISGSTALGTGVHQIFGLYNNARALLRGTADDGATAWPANTLKTLTLTSTFTTTYSGLHYVAILVQATTVPTLWAKVGSSTVNGIAPILNGNSDSGITALPANAAAIGATANFVYAFVS